MTYFSKWTDNVLNLFIPPSNDLSQNGDVSLAELAKSGNRPAFQKLLERNYDFIYNVAYRFTGHAEDAEDITQDVCLALADKLKSFRANARFQTWLYTLIMNACRDAYRKNATQQTKLLDFAELDEQLRLNNHEHTQQITWLYRQLAKLNEPLRMTAFLVLAEDLSHAEVGKILDCRESTVSWRMSEVRKLLKQRNEEAVDE